jgi:hypothetical protein
MGISYGQEIDNKIKNGESKIGAGVPFICKIKDNIIYNIDSNYPINLIKISDLLKIRNAINNTLLKYEEENITDDVLELEIEKAIALEKKENEEWLRNCRVGVKVPKKDNLYLIKDITNNTLKIGRSVDAKSRLRSLQVSTSNKLELLYEIKGEGEEEESTHAKFKKLRLASEWFKYDDSIIYYFKNYEI